MLQKTYVFYLHQLGVSWKNEPLNRFWDSTFCHHHCMDRAPPRAPGCKAQVVKVYDVQIHGDNGPGQQSSIANIVRCFVPKADCLIWHHQRVINANHKLVSLSLVSWACAQWWWPDQSIGISSPLEWSKLTPQILQPEVASQHHQACGIWGCGCWSLEHFIFKAAGIYFYF